MTVNEDLSAKRTSGLVRSRDGAEAPAEGGGGGAATAVAPQSPMFSLSDESNRWVAGIVGAILVLATAVVWASGASISDFLTKLGYLFIILILIYAACALVQMTVTRPKTRYVIIGSFGTFAFLIALIGIFNLTVPGMVTDPENQRRSGTLLLVIAGATFVPMFKRVRLLLGRLTPLNPNSTVDISGVIIALWIAIASLTALLTVDLEAIIDQTNITVADSITNALALPVVAFSLVGIWITRSPREAVKRLGLERVSLRQALISLGMVVPLLIFGIGLDAIGRRVQPELYAKLERVLEAMSSNVTSPFVALVIGFSAGIGEEILFRGAIQPRFGIPITAFLFAIIHTQYGFSYGTFGILLIGFVLGYQRKYMNTTSAIITHGAYNTVAFLITYFAQNGS